jgi:hypothetical protein
MDTVFLPRGEVGQLPGKHRFGGHPGEFVRDAGEIHDRLAELLPIPSVGQTKSECVLRHAQSPRAGLNAGAFKRLHPPPEALPLDAAEEAISRHDEILEAQPRPDAYEVADANRSGPPRWRSGVLSACAWAAANGSFFSQRF